MPQACMGRLPVRTSRAGRTPHGPGPPAPPATAHHSASRSMRQLDRRDGPPPLAIRSIRRVPADPTSEEGSARQARKSQEGPAERRSGRASPAIRGSGGRRWPGRRPRGRARRALASASKARPVGPGERPERSCLKTAGIAQVPATGLRSRDRPEQADPLDDPRVLLRDPSRASASTAMADGSTQEWVSATHGQPIEGRVVARSGRPSCGPSPGRPSRLRGARRTAPRRVRPR